MLLIVQNFEKLEKKVDLMSARDRVWGSLRITWRVVLKGISSRSHNSLTDRRRPNDPLTDNEKFERKHAEETHFRFVFLFFFSFSFFLVLSNNLPLVLSPSVFSICPSIYLSFVLSVFRSVTFPVP